MTAGVGSRERIRRAALEPESPLIRQLAAGVELDPRTRSAISARTAALVERLRDGGRPAFLQSFLGEYGLSSEEGVALMSMAEAFLRVPDAATLDELIAEKIVGSDWQSHSGHASSFLVNASTWALMLSGRLLTRDQQAGLIHAMRDLLRRFGEPVVRVAMAEAMTRLGKHFVVGETIGEAIQRTAGDSRYRDYCFSFDMLGEAALTEADATTYFESYQTALKALAASAGAELRANPGISVKLSALHPRFELLQHSRGFKVLTGRMEELVEMAAAANLPLTIDGEEAERMEYTLDVFEALARSPRHADWDGLGVVVQAYARNSPAIIDWLVELAADTGRRLMVRLVKGAYWDTEIKRAQVMGLGSYPVFTRKAFTDVACLHAVQQLLGARGRLYPQFATHNAHTLTAVLALCESRGLDRREFEFQRLYGMGEDLHEYTRREHGTRHRVYAPVGEHEDLLAYLVRRLLENGATSSFVHQLTDRSVSAASIAVDPLARLENRDGEIEPGLAPPSRLFGTRTNSPGFDLGNRRDLARIEQARAPWREHRWSAGLLPVANHDAGSVREIRNPANHGDVVGQVTDATQADVDLMFSRAASVSEEWAATPVRERARLLERGADLLVEHFGELAALLCREAGKTIADVIGEWREAIDFLRYYAAQARTDESLGKRRPLGMVVCISPWNFPLSIFSGQVAAALVTGNVVLAKPAEQSSLIAHRAIRLLHQAGVPEAVLQFLPGDGPGTGAALCREPRVGGVCFTGSDLAAGLIYRALARTAPPTTRFIAETGGINAMLVDSTALPEQTIRDIISSAFFSAGQRCSALRIVYLQREIAERFITMLVGAMDCLRIGDPWRRDTDLGPVIDQAAQTGIERYVQTRKVLHRLDVPDSGAFTAPVLIEVSGIGEVEREVFGPVLHVARYRSDETERVIDDINRAGYGLTAAIHSRLSRRVEHCIERLAIGNIYVNRNQTGAVVESQPFGGMGRSGTGPKAGGPLYLRAFSAAEVHGGQPPAETPGAGREIALNALQRAMAALDAGDWGRAPDRLSVLQGIRPDSPALAVCPGPTRRQMPGPTGERNIYQLRPLGHCLCLGPTPEMALEQALQSLAAGNPTLICCRSSEPLAQAVAALQAAAAPVAMLNGAVAPATLERLQPLAAVSWGGNPETARRIWQALAARKGALVRFITAPVEPEAWLTECHVCNDVTSSGGNVELMSAAANA